MQLEEIVSIENFQKHYLVQAIIQNSYLTVLMVNARKSINKRSNENKGSLTKPIYSIKNKIFMYSSKATIIVDNIFVHKKKKN